MKREAFRKDAINRLALLAAILLAGISAARAQVTPRVCVDTNYQTGTTTLAQASAVGNKIITVNGYVPPLVSLVINPGGATEERVPYINIRIDGSGPFTIGINESLHVAVNPAGFNNPGSSYALSHAHIAGETVRFEGYTGTASFGYRNAGNNTVNIPRSISSFNFFTPGPTSYTGQPNQFQPGIYESVLTLPFGGQTSDTLAWVLGGGGTSNVATARNGQGQNCAKMTYQGRLNDGGNAANGEYDLRLTVFDTETGGTAQSNVVVIENAMVTNGIFTVTPNFGSSFLNNSTGRFLEIAVRPGNSTGTFTALAPRQPITNVPYAVNAQAAQTAQTALVYLIPQVTAPPANTIEGGCGNSTFIGNTRLNTTTGRLYVCTLTGWKSVLLE